VTIEIEEALAAHAARDPRLRLLQAQWEYDKALVGRALQVVGNTFPHYSLHDASHSSTILIHVTRLLGRRVSELSATDLWLLLEAAYWHDTGMVIDDSTAREWWASSDFKEHLAQLQGGSEQSLAWAARHVAELTNYSTSDAWPLDVRRAVTWVLADYGRKLHAARSRQLVAQPSLIGVDSPRVLIPDRLYRWLGEITHAHGLAREAVLALPFRENGIATDLCHPRLVA
jgi:hypothetical protein